MGIAAKCMGGKDFVPFARYTTTVTPIAFTALDAFMIIPINIPDLIVPEGRACTTCLIILVLDAHKSRLTVVRAMVEIARLAVGIEEIRSRQ